MLSKLLWRKKGRIYILGAIGGALLGFFLMLLAIQVFKDVELATEKLIGGEYLIINKEAKAGPFSKNDIAELAAQPYLKKVIPLTRSLNRVQLNIPMAGIYMEIPFEAVPGSILEIDEKNFNWSPGDSVLPVIIPTYVLSIYNHVFAPQLNLPQFSDEQLANLTPQLNLITGDSSIVFYGKLVGFSNRVNSFLLPLDFIEYANANYSSKGEPESTRLLLVAKDATDPALSEFLTSHGYEFNAERLAASRYSAVLKIVIKVIALIAIIIIFLALEIFLLTFAMMILTSNYEIKRLLELGYTHLSLMKGYRRQILIYSGLVFVSAAALLILSHHQISSLFAEYGIDIAGMPSMMTFVWGFIVFLLFIAINYQMVGMRIKKMALGKY